MPWKHFIYMFHNQYFFHSVIIDTFHWNNEYWLWKHITNLVNIKQKWCGNFTHSWVIMHLTRTVHRLMTKFETTGLIALNRTPLCSCSTQSDQNIQFWATMLPLINKRQFSFVHNIWALWKPPANFHKRSPYRNLQNSFNGVNCWICWMDFQIKSFQTRTTRTGQQGHVT